MTIARRIGTVAAGLVFGIAAAWFGFVLGSDKVIVCGSGNALDRFAENVTQGLGAGHIDGASATHCLVPSASAWIGAACALVGVLGITIAISWRLGRRGSNATASLG